MPETTDEGFPKGNVAQTLRKILYPELSEHQVEAIVVCLMAHLLIENKLNRLLYRWLRQDAPGWKENEKVSKAEDDLWKNIVKMDFAKKYLLVEPFLAMHFLKKWKKWGQTPFSYALETLWQELVPSGPSRTD